MVAARILFCYTFDALLNLCSKRRKVMPRRRIFFRLSHEGQASGVQEQTSFFKTYKIDGKNHTYHSLTLVCLLPCSRYAIAFVPNQTNGAFLLAHTFLQAHSIFLDVINQDATSVLNVWLTLNLDGFQQGSQVSLLMKPAALVVWDVSLLCSHPEECRKCWLCLACTKIFACSSEKHFADAPPMNERLSQYTH